MADWIKIIAGAGGIVALLSVIAFAQSGATGGTLGKSGKSVSGAAVIRKAPQAAIREKAPTKAPASCASLLTARSWKWAFDETVTFVATDGDSGRMSLSSSLNSGTWECDGPRTVTLRWNLFGFVDRLTISADGRRVSGTNNLGQAISFGAR